MRGNDQKNKELFSSLLESVHTHRYTDADQQSGLPCNKGLEYVQPLQDKQIVLSRAPE